MDYRKSFDPNTKIKKYLSKMEEEIFLPFYKINSMRLFNEQTSKEEMVSIGTEFSGRNDYYTLSTTAKIPYDCENQIPSIKVDFGKTMSGFNGGFESLLYIEGERICSVDTYHNCVAIPEKFYGKEVELEFKIWTGFEGGGEPQELVHRLKRFDVGFEIVTCRSLVLHIQALSEVYEICPDNTELKLKYRKILSEVLLELERETGYKEILMIIKKFMSGLTKTEEVELMMFGHAHIDLAWLWTLKNGREKTIRTLSSVISHCKEYDDYKYIHSSPQVFAYLKENQREMFNEVVELVKKGQIEIEGGMWVEADCNLPSGESLSKQFLYGKRFIKENFGYDSSVLWLPDVFGYSWALPQLMKNSNISTFMTTKISWNKFNKMPTETFKWKGIDGTEVLTHFMTTPQPRSDHWNKTYTAEITADLLSRTWSTYEDQLINKKLPVSYGYGDGGGGPTREMIDLIEIYDKLPGLPNLSYKNLSDSASSLHHSIDENRISSWDGELYLEYHRGTFTTQAEIKKYNKLMEVELKKLEILSVLSGSMNLNDKIKKIWEEVLLFQFHDILPGSSLHEVNKEVVCRYHQLEEQVKELKSLCFKSSDKLYVLNHHLNHSENLVAEYACDDENITFSINDKRLSSYYFDGRHYIAIEKIKPLSSEILTVESKEDYKPNLIESNKPLLTKLYEIEFNESGNISKLKKSKCLRNLISEYANKLVIYEDRPFKYDAWDFDIDYQETVYTPKLLSSSLISNDDLATVIKNEYAFNESRIIEQIIINQRTGLITFNHTVDWKETNKFLRSLTKTGVRSSKFTSGTQYGKIERNNNSNTSWDLAQFEICAHNYIDISQYDRGVSLLSDYKYGYNCNEDTIGISLLRSPKYPDHLADMGTHSYTYHIFPHDGNYDNGNVYEMAFKQAERLDAGYQAINEMNYSLIDSLGLANSNLEISSLSPSFEGNSIIFRAAEIRGGTTSIKISNDTLLIREVYIDENPISDFLDISKEVYFNPFEVKTFEVILNDRK